jgi:tripartite-type tricarboxylate transporter receptor subunit TctC
MASGVERQSSFDFRMTRAPCRNSISATGLPEPVVARLNREVIKVLDLPEVRKALRQEIIEPIAMRPDELTNFVQSEIMRWTPIVQSTGLKQ